MLVKFVKVFKIPSTIWALHIFLPMIQAGEDHSQTSCKQCSCLQRSHQEFRCAITFLMGVNITVFLGWGTMKTGNIFMVSWCLIAFINLTSLSCQHVGWYKLEQSHNCAEMCLVVGSHSRSRGGRCSNQVALPEHLHLGWAYTED